MPRRPASRSLSTDLELQTPHQNQAPRSSDPGFLSRFLGEASSMHKGKVQGGDENGNREGDVDGDVEMGGDNSHQDVEARAIVQGATNSTPTVSRAPKRKHAEMEDAPINMNELRLRQLKEDQEAYLYDLEWTQSALHGAQLTPAEERSFELRQLDLGHQLRMTNHTIAQMESEMRNQRYYGGPASSSYARPGLLPALHPRTSFMDAEPPQERRGPGRPPGSKNRPKDAATGPGTATPQPAPSSNAQKAAALASAGAKRILPTEIRVATPNGGGASASGGVGGAAEGSSSKRPRVEVGSPIGSATEDENEVNETSNGPAEAQVSETVEDVAAKTTSGRRTARFRDATKEEDREQTGGVTAVASKKKNINASSAGAASTPSASTHALPNRTPTSKKNAGSSPKNDSAATDDATTEPETPAAATTADASSSQPDQTGPGGAKYQRLGHHMCQLCTSQKYLMQSTPKQPSEPSSWPLRDISKMVTHYTRMHGEHNKMERCMELGRALEDNRGPFRYWLQETKRVKVPLDQINEAIQSLHHGRLPDLLRRLSNAAKLFPQD